MAATSVFVNLPVQDLNRSVEFFTGLGYSVNPQFTNEEAASIVISDTIYVMLLVKPFFATFTSKQIVDASTGTEAIIALSTESREEVDALFDRAIAAGGTGYGDGQDLGFMYQRAFQDPDGHQWEVLWMDPNYVEG
ncbi:MAG: Glyoxalase-like domain protein [Microbacteriaceae bacterium]|jgi:predicted lactoylglutathione lyase|nr:Glyoxalase-like domain protein [Microbacteriaceae bacterium]